MPALAVCASRFADFARISAADTIAGPLTIGTTNRTTRLSPPRLRRRPGSAAPAAGGRAHLAQPGRAARRGGRDGLFDPSLQRGGRCWNVQRQQSGV